MLSFDTFNPLAITNLILQRKCCSSIDIGSLLLWIMLATLVSSSPIRFPSKTAQNHFQMSTDGSYLFFYDTGPGKHQSFREEKRTKGGTISGSYGYVDPLGALHITEYVADRKGYRASLEVYKPIHQMPEGPTIIVGPLPADLRSLEVMKRKESVFERFQFPIEPFESLKVINNTPEKPEEDYKELPYQRSYKKDTFSRRVSESFPKEETNEILNNSLKPNTKDHSVSAMDFTSLSGDDSNLPVMDIAALEKELKSLADLLRKDPILLIGPLPAHLPDLKSLSSLEIDNEILESSRSLRSPLKNKNNSSSSTIANFNISNSQVFENIDSAFKLVIPSSVDDLNYVEKDLVSMGENIDAFLRFPSSGLLQGEYMPPSTNKNLLLPQKPIKFNNQPKFDKRNSRTKKLNTLYLSNYIS